MDPLSRIAAEAAINAIAQASGAKIAFLAGAGVEHDNAAAALKAVAEQWSIPVATTLRAKGVFPGDHPLSLGVFGYAGTRHATAALLEDIPDVLIVLGSGMNERDTMHWTLRDGWARAPSPFMSTPTWTSSPPTAVPPTSFPATAALSSS